MITALLSLVGVLLVAAFVCTIASTQNKLPLWVAVLLVVLANLLSLLLGTG